MPVKRKGHFLRTRVQLSPSPPENLNIVKFRKPKVNYQINAPEVRVVDWQGKNLGVFRLQDARRMAMEQGLDLIEIAPNAKPPVAKLADYGKFLYALEKQERKKKTKEKTAELKTVRLSPRISKHDMEVRAKMAERFFKKGHIVRVELQLKGRENIHKDFAISKMQEFLKALGEVNIVQDIKRQPRGFTVIVSKKLTNETKRNENVKINT